GARELSRCHHDPDPVADQPLDRGHHHRYFIAMDAPEHNYFIPALERDFFAHVAVVAVFEASHVLEIAGAYTSVAGGADFEESLTFDLVLGQNHGDPAEGSLDERFDGLVSS